MKNILIAVAVAGMVTACTEGESLIAEAQPTPPTQAPDSTTLMLYVPYYGDTLLAMPYKTLKLVEWRDGATVTVGNTWRFSNDDSSLQATVSYYAEQDSIVSFTGRIGGSTFIIFPSDSTMNVCNGPQGLSVNYRLLINNSENL